MGLETGTRGTRQYVSIVAGRFNQRVDENTPGAILRVIEKKDGSKKTVHELIYETASGIITGIEVKEEGQFGDQLNINMFDGGSSFTVTLSMSGREAKSFLCTLKNIDLKERVIFLPFNFTSKENGKKVIGMNTYQGGREKENKVQPYFSKETPNGLPQVPEESDMDDFKLVMKQQEIYLKKWVKKFIADTTFPSSGSSQPEGVTTRMEPNAKAGGTFEKEKEKIYDNASEIDPNDPASDLPF